MSHEINDLICLIENTLEDDSLLFNTDMVFAGYNPSAEGIIKKFLRPGTQVLYLPHGQSIDNAIHCTAEESTWDDEKFSYQPSEYTKELDWAASSREQGPVHKTRPVGPRLYGKAARQAYMRSWDAADFSLLSEDGEQYEVSISSRGLQTKKFTRNKKKYEATCVPVYGNGNDGLVILQIKLANRLSPEVSAARTQKAKANKLNKVNNEISQLEARLKELYAMKEKLESK